MNGAGGLVSPTFFRRSLGISSDQFSHQYEIETRVINVQQKRGVKVVTMGAIYNGREVETS